MWLILFSLFNVGFGLALEPGGEVVLRLVAAEGGLLLRPPLREVVQLQYVVLVTANLEAVHGVVDFLGH